MNLDEFIKDVIVNIYNGISDAKNETSRNVIPQGESADGMPNVKGGSRNSGYMTLVSNIEFEVSLTNGEKDGVAGGIGVLLGALSLGAKTNNETTQTSLSKIKFTIPIELK